MEIGKTIKIHTFPKKEREQPIPVPNWPVRREEPIPAPYWPVREPVLVPVRR